jgi:branched-chain amino acid transport system substrate-binding protein
MKMHALPMQALSAINKLTSIDKIQGLVGSYCIIGMVPAALVLEKANVVGFHTTVVPQILLDSGEYVFTTNVRIKSEAEHLAQYAYNKLGLRRAATMYASSQWGEDYTGYFSREFKRLGGTDGT